MLPVPGIMTDITIIIIVGITYFRRKQIIIITYIVCGMPPKPRRRRLRRRRQPILYRTLPTKTLLHIGLRFWPGQHRPSWKVAVAYLNSTCHHHSPVDPQK